MPPRPYLEICLIWAALWVNICGICISLAVVSPLHINYSCSPIPFWVRSFLRGGGVCVWEETSIFKKGNKKSSCEHFCGKRSAVGLLFTYVLSPPYWTHLQLRCCGINLLARVIQTLAECMSLLFLLDLGAEANNNSSRVGTDAGYLSRTVLGGLYFTAVKKCKGFLFHRVHWCSCCSLFIQLLCLQTAEINTLNKFWGFFTFSSSFV